MNRFLGSLVFLALYCLSIGVATTTYAASSSQDENAIKKSVSSVVYAAQNYQVVTSDNSISGGFQFDGKVKTLFFTDFTVTSTLDQFNVYFNQYNLGWRNLLIDTRKRSKIFPFHSFW